MIHTPYPADTEGLDAIDAEAFLARCKFNTSLAMVLLEEFEASGASTVNAIDSAARRGESGLVADLAHALKGTAAVFAADALRAMSSTTELAGEAGETERVVALIDDLRQEMNRCLAAVTRLRGQLV